MRPCPGPPSIQSTRSEAGGILDTEAPDVDDVQFSYCFCFCLYFLCHISETIVSSKVPKIYTNVFFKEIYSFSSYLMGFLNNGSCEPLLSSDLHVASPGQIGAASISNYDQLLLLIIIFTLSSLIVFPIWVASSCSFLKVHIAV